MVGDSRILALANNTRILTVGTVGSRAILFLVLPVASFTLSPSELGTFDLSLTYLGLFMLAVTLQLEQGVFRFTLEDPNKARSYFTTAFVVAFLLSAISGLALGVVGGTLTSYAYSVPLALYFVSFAIYTCVMEYLRGLELLADYALITLTTAGFTLILCLASVAWSDSGLSGLIWAHTAPHLSIATWAMHRYRPFDWSKIPRPRSPELRRMLAYSLPLVPNVAAFWVVSVSDRTLITIFRTSGDSGLYAVASRLPAALVIVFGVFSLAFQQTAFSSVRDDDRDELLAGIIVRSTRVAISICCLIVGLSPIAFSTMFGPEFRSALEYVPGLAAGACFFSVARLLGSVLLADYRATEVAVSTVVSAVLNIGLNLALIPRWGVQGAVLATMGSYFLMLAWRFRSLGLSELPSASARQLIPPVLTFGAISLLVVSQDPRPALSASFLAAPILATVLAFRELLLFPRTPTKAE